MPIHPQRLFLVVSLCLTVLGEVRGNCELEKILVPAGEEMDWDDCQGKASLMDHHRLPRVEELRAAGVADCDESCSGESKYRETEMYPVLPGRVQHTFRKPYYWISRCGERILSESLFGDYSPRGYESKTKYTISIGSLARFYYVLDETKPCKINDTDWDQCPAHNPDACKDYNDDCCIKESEEHRCQIGFRVVETVGSCKFDHHRTYSCVPGALPCNTSTFASESESKPSTDNSFLVWFLSILGLVGITIVISLYLTKKSSTGQSAPQPVVALTPTSINIVTNNAGTPTALQGVVVRQS